MMGVAFLLPALLAQAPPMPPPAPAQLPWAWAAAMAWALPPPKVSFALKNRHGHATPVRTPAAHAGGGNTDVTQPKDDTLIFAMTGVVTAGPHPFTGSSANIEFELTQDFEIAFADPKLKKAKLTIEAQVIGLLRGDKHGGGAKVGKGAVDVGCAGHSIVSLAIEGHGVAGDDYLSINDRKGPCSVSVPAGEYHLAQIFGISADHARSIAGKAAAAEFAPDPALDATWISVKDPFHGAIKKEFGFRVTLKVEPE